MKVQGDPNIGKSKQEPQKYPKQGSELVSTYYDKHSNTTPRHGSLLPKK